MITTFRTARLLIAPWERDPAGSEALYEALAGLLTPPVMEHLPEPVQDLSQGIASWADARAAQGRVFTVAHAGRLQGLFFVFHETGADEARIGYLLGEHSWGQGLATELVTGALEAWPRDAPVRMLAGVAVGNPASARVLVKCGFEQLGQADDRGILHFGRSVP